MNITIMNVKYENFIGIYENAYSQEFCNAAIKYCDDMLDAGFGINRQQEDSTVAAHRKNDLTIFASSEQVIDFYVTKELYRQFNTDFWAGPYKEYATKFSILQNFASHGSFACRVQKTPVGEGAAYHTWHSEAMNRGCSGRILTWMLYLNDVEEGGETEFLYYPKRIKPKAGTLLIWPVGFTHTHRGNQPLSNTKYILTGWVEF
jgi:hypothetical protein